MGSEAEAFPPHKRPFFCKSERAEAMLWGEASVMLLTHTYLLPVSSAPEHTAFRKRACNPLCVTYCDNWGRVDRKSEVYIPTAKEYNVIQYDKAFLLNRSNSVYFHYVLLAYFTADRNID